MNTRQDGNSHKARSLDEISGKNTLEKRKKEFRLLRGSKIEKKSNPNCFFLGCLPLESLAVGDILGQNVAKYSMSSFLGPVLWEIDAAPDVSGRCPTGRIHDKPGCVNDFT